MSQTIPAARLHKARDLRVDEVPRPGDPPPGQVLLRVEVCGICGSDLHTYRHGAIGDIALTEPLIVGHEFAGVVERTGAGCLDGEGRPLAEGARVAVDPAQPCGLCEWCRRGDPNLCPQIAFCGLAGHPGAMRPWMHVPGSTCFPTPEGMSAVAAAMLEPLGVAIHAMDLARLRLGETAAVIGAGPIGLCIVRLAALAGAGAVYAADRLPCRVEAAARLGPAFAFLTGGGDSAADDAGGLVESVLAATGGRGVDVAFEAATGGSALVAAAELVAPGGRLIVVGIDEDDRLALRHSTARRKGLTIRMVRRMKHAYPRAIRLVEQGRIDLEALVSHRYPLRRAPEAFATSADYRDGVLKAMIDCQG